MKEIHYEQIDLYFETEGWTVLKPKRWLGLQQEPFSSMLVYGNIWREEESCCSRFTTPIP